MTCSRPRRSRPRCGQFGSLPAPWCGDGEPMTNEAVTVRAGAADIAAAYRHCETITRQQAKNFSYGIALLPGAKRRALSAVYAFARRIDDIGDGTMAADDKITALNQARAAVLSLASGGSAISAEIGADPVLTALQDAAARFTIPVAAFGEL